MNQSQRPVIFLDFDDVICLNRPYGGYDAKLAIHDESSEVWARLFDAKAKQHLEMLHEKFTPWFVISSSWWWLFDREELVEVMQRSGLSFVSDSLHSAWATPKQSRQGMRATEVKSWLALHPEFSNAWVVIDDKLSGTGFKNWSREALSYVVLCQLEVGLQTLEVAQLHDALERRMNIKS
ncbi:HAD domain-containing protein [Comamonas sp. 26]|uniref:HAD domain-containing protein n=1 Tax=Comamonas sp. 26 TaxID=2035201 RepID=UPI000C185965|nr:HAD domain-containing protein [Comamonas sp. 26]PIF98484.1 hypothetical protein CLU84_3966 [Comamonas sp. 26]